MYYCSIIILRVETPLSIITLIVTRKARVLQKQHSIMFSCNDKNFVGKHSRLALMCTTRAKMQVEDNDIQQKHVDYSTIRQLLLLQNMLQGKRNSDFVPPPDQKGFKSCSAHQNIEHLCFQELGSTFGLVLPCQFSSYF